MSAPASNTSMPLEKSGRRKLPFRITLLLIVVLITTVWNAVRFFTAVAWRATLDGYMPPALVAYVAATGAFWTMIGIFVLGSFFRGARRSGLMILGAAAAYAAWAWADRLLVQSGSHANWPFELVVTIVLLVYTAIVVLEPHYANFFRRENHD